MLSEAYKYVVVALSSLAAAYIIDWIADVNHYAPDTSLTAIILALTTAVIFTTVHYVFIGLKEWRWFRRIPYMEDRFRFEGKWIEIYDSRSRKPSKNDKGEKEPDARSREHDRLYAIFEIVYDSSLPDSYFLKGTAYNEHGEYHSKWSSRKMDFNISKNIIDYFYDGSYHVTGEEVSGHGTLDFNSSGSTLRFGTGFFLDYGRSSDRISFEFSRLTKASIDKISKNKSLPFHIEPERYFIKEFHKEFRKETETDKESPSEGSSMSNVVDFDGGQ